MEPQEMSQHEDIQVPPASSLLNYKSFPSQHLYVNTTCFITPLIDVEHKHQVAIIIQMLIIWTLITHDACVTGATFSLFST